MHSLSQPRTLILTERKPHIARLAPGDVAFLMEHHRGCLEVLPTGRRDCYRLTALGCIGVLIAPTCRFIIRSKVPLANVFAMLDPIVAVPDESDRIAPASGTEALEFLAGQLACRMAERVAAGLHRAYREQCEQGTVLHGRLDLSAQMRETPGRKELLHSQYDELSADVSSNRAVKATAEALLASPLLGAEVRAALRQVLIGFESVSSVALSARLWDVIEAARLPAEYRPLLDLCRLLADSLTLNDAAGNTSTPSFLLDLERIFEMHVTRGVVEVFAQSSDHTVAVQATHTVSEPVADQPDLTIRPDLTIDRDGRTVLVIDAKWKRLPRNAETADLYQVLAYGTTLGANGVVLVYPGKRWSFREYQFRHTPLRLMLCTLQVGVTRPACLRSVGRLARALKNLIV
jgi:5-methylcytosine-specific restriction endonuclease McrBC regulatory subunit McrC